MMFFIVGQRGSGTHTCVQRWGGLNLLRKQANSGKEQTCTAGAVNAGGMPRLPPNKKGQKGIALVADMVLR